MSAGSRGLGRRFGPSLVAIAAIVVIALLPDFASQISSQNQAVETDHGRIQEIVPQQSGEAFRPPYANVLILDGPRSGQVMQAYLEGPGGSQVVANYQVGDEVVVTVTKDETGQPYIAVSDRWRAPMLGFFVLVFALCVVLVGGARGARSLLALGLTIALIIKVLIPLIILGVPPVPLAVATATGVTILTIALTEGWSRMSGAAIIGTAGSLALTGLLGAAATALASFTYSAGSDLAFLQTSSGGGLDLRGLLLAAFILGAVGVLDDATVTQAALVASLAEHGATGRHLVGSAFDVGRSHIAATVNTLFLAYIGAGLPLIVTILVSNQPAALILNSEEVATEVVRTVVGSLGILAAVPLTTIVAAALVDQPGARQTAQRRGTIIAGASGVIALALVLTAVLPLGQGRPVPLMADRLGPSSVPGGDPGAGPVLNEPLPTEELPAESGAGGPTPADSGAASQPQLLDVRETYALETGDGSTDLTVESLRAKAVDTGTEITIVVRYRNTGSGPFEVDPGAWSLITADGEDVALRPTTNGGLIAGSLDAGASRTGSLHGVVKSTPDQTFVGFTDPDDVLEFVIPAG
jgi:uncharacterized membrane protein